jgi:hypothetical protein
MSAAGTAPERIYESPSAELVAMHQATVAAEERLEALQIKFLRACGWDRVCDTPGSYWVWTKQWCGRTYTCGTDLAISFQLGMWA